MCPPLANDLNKRLTSSSDDARDNQSSGIIKSPRHGSHPDCRAPLIQIDAPHRDADPGKERYRHPLSTAGKALEQHQRDPRASSAAREWGQHSMEQLGRPAAIGARGNFNPRKTLIGLVDVRTAQPSPLAVASAPSRIAGLVSGFAVWRSRVGEDKRPRSGHV